MIKDLNKRSEENTVVGENVIVSGKLQTSSDIQINGIVKGEVSSQGSVTVGPKAKIEGPVKAREITIHGEVKGSIVAENSLELTEAAKVYGDVETKSLIIRAGAIFVGKSNMPSTSTKTSISLDTQSKTKSPTPELEIE